MDWIELVQARDTWRALVNAVMKFQIFHDTKSFRSHYVPGVDSASNINEYLEHFLGLKAAGA